MKPKPIRTDHKINHGQSNLASRPAHPTMQTEATSADLCAAPLVPEAEPLITPFELVHIATQISLFYKDQPPRNHFEGAYQLMSEAKGFLENRPVRDFEVEREHFFVTLGVARPGEKLLNYWQKTGRKIAFRQILRDVPSDTTGQKKRRAWLGPITTVPGLVKAVLRWIPSEQAKRIVKTKVMSVTEYRLLAEKQREAIENRAAKRQKSGVK